MARYQKFLTTADVAEILDMPDWRVIKFVQGKEYGIKPAFTTGKGSGSRRLYDVGNVCEIALALRLLETGLRSKAIGKVIRQLRRGGKKEGNEKLSAKLKLGEQKLADLHVTIMREPRPGEPLDERRFQWVGFSEGLDDAAFILRDIQENEEEYFLCDIIIVPVGSMFLKLKERLRKIESEGEKE